MDSGAYGASQSMVVALVRLTPRRPCDTCFSGHTPRDRVRSATALGPRCVVRSGPWKRSNDLRAETSPRISAGDFPGRTGHGSVHRAQPSIVGKTHGGQASVAVGGRQKTSADSFTCRRRTGRYIIRSCPIGRTARSCF